MIHPVDTILSLVLLSILFSFGSSRLSPLIKMLAFQGIVVCVVPLFVGQVMSGGNIAFTLVTLAIRGIIIPGWIYLAIRKVAIQRAVEPIVGFHASIFCGLLLIVGATLAGNYFETAYREVSDLLLPTAIALLGGGMFLLMARRNAIAMVLGYMMMENGIYLAGTTFSLRARHIVEFGILLDILAGVMIMAVILQNMKQTFDDVDTARLRTLKE
ncbi:HyfE: predicted hydrogenase 4, component E [Desulfosarcina cetonica]|uniref:NADH-quinone oxidoreductase subunit K n=1 Tax=Desulfosarcina cetonica TaxID=90730 RepID=UPI0009FA8772|nr:NADH-quinone oxidoreductase subunit K [Desulfosarcina cetonica]VTR64885.1 HyfE: predicted hydrogenase 4, component E [Desulfosarcina cetonica]